MNTETTLKVVRDRSRAHPGEISVADLFELQKQTALTTQLTTITHTAPSSADYAIQDLINTSAYGFVTKDEGNSVLSVIANLQTRVSQLETKLKAIGLLT